MPAKYGLTILKRSGLRDVRVTGEAASADPAAADKFPDTIKKTIEEKGYLLK